MSTTSPRTYQRILVTVLKIVCVVSIFVAPIALLQVISASKQHQIKGDVQDGNAQSSIETQVSETDLSSTGRTIGQLGELFDVSHRKDRRDGKSILRLRRQTDDETRPTVAQLTAAGTAAGIMLGDQVVEAQMAANYDPELAMAGQSDDENDAEEPPDSNVDLSTLQSFKQPAPSQGGGLTLDKVALEQQQSDPADNVNPEQMPDSMESLMRSEEEDPSNEPGDGEQNSEQPSASSQVADDQRALTNGDEDDIEQNDSNNQNSLLAAANLLRGNLPIQGQTSDLIHPGLANDFNGTTIPNGIFSRISGDPSEDLSAAAGHHYKKKKKVKKIIIKKKKKGKKLKKIKIIKYKKKKKVVKKSKKSPKKHHHHHDHGKYYMYAKVPKKKSWEFGFKKGNKKHWIERHEKGHKSKFKTKVKWFDKKSKGKGVHIWDYNHHDKKKKGHY